MFVPTVSVSDLLLVDVTYQNKFELTDFMSTDINMDNIFALYISNIFYILILVEMRCTLSPVLVVIKQTTSLFAPGARQQCANASDDFWVKACSEC